MKKNKGFTLIELLAVIVILAVIALIATPIIMNVIQESKKGADKDSAYGYIKAVELAISNTLLKNVNANIDGDYIIDSDGNLEKYNTTTKKFETIQIDYKGTKPKGTAKISQEKIVAMDLAFDIGSFLYDGAVINEKTDKNLFPIATWQANSFDSYNGQVSNIMKNGAFTLKYTGKNNSSISYAYTQTRAEKTVSSFDPVGVFKFGIIVEPNTTYTYSVDIKDSNVSKYMLHIMEIDKDFQNVAGHDTANKNTIDFTTASNTKYIVWSLNISECTTSSQSTFYNFQLSKK